MKELRFTKETIMHIARLARIELTAEEVKKFEEDLSSIVDFVEKLREVNTEHVATLTPGMPLERATRNDIPDADRGEYPSKLIEAAPRIKKQYIEVPAVFEDRS